MTLQYPINGFAPGNYSNRCLSCDQEFTGDKRAVCCEQCALQILEMAAEHYAREMHGDQLYGELPYVDGHVTKVVAVLRQFEFNSAFIAAGWLHDVIEDTPATREDVSRKFGPQVGLLVWACTGVGKNRRERNAAIYEKIATYPDASIVKVADRIANVEASDPDGKHRQMYLKERETFHELVARNAPRPLVNRLEAAYNTR